MIYTDIIIVFTDHVLHSITLQHRPIPFYHRHIALYHISIHITTFDHGPITSSTFYYIPQQPIHTFSTFTTFDNIISHITVSHFITFDHRHAMFSHLTTFHQVAPQTDYISSHCPQAFHNNDFVGPECAFQPLILNIFSLDFCYISIYMDKLLALMLIPPGCVVASHHNYDCL